MCLRNRRVNKHQLLVTTSTRRAFFLTWFVLLRPARKRCRPMAAGGAGRVQGGMHTAVPSS